MSKTTTKPISIMALTFLVLISLAVPPLAVITVPLLIVVLVRGRRHLVHLVRSRDAYLEERDLLASGNFWRSK